MADELRELSTDLGALGFSATRAAQKCVAKGAVNIRRRMRREASGERHGMARFITYDLALGGMSAIVGPEKRGAGNLANIAYFGGVHGGGGHIPDPMGALAAEVPKLEKALIDSVDGVFFNRRAVLP